MSAGIYGAIVGSAELIARVKVLPDRAANDMEQTVRRWAYKIEFGTKRKLNGAVYKVRTSRLITSISPGSPDSSSRIEITSNSVFAYVGTKVEYAKPLFYGRGPIDIVPVKAKALKFEIGGVTIFRKRVHLPARPGKNPLQMTLDENRAAMIADFEATLRRSMAEGLKP